MTWAPACRALAGIVGPHVCQATRRAVLPFLARHLRGLDVDVAAALTSEPALVVESPALFAPQVGEGGRRSAEPT